jgi:hypothetical protein
VSSSTLDLQRRSRHAALAREEMKSHPFSGGLRFRTRVPNVRSWPA